MNWIEVIWTMMAAASLTLGVVHLFVWFKQRSDYAHLLFFALACSAATFGAFEMAMVQASSPESHATLLRWAHVPLALFVFSIVGFVRFFLGAGRVWLAGAVCGLRAVALVLNFTTGQNVNFTRVTALDRFTLAGADVLGPVGITSPWTIVPQLSNLLLVVFIVDAAITLWRGGDAVARRRAVFVGGGIAACVALVASVAGLTMSGLVHAPTVLMPGAFIIVLAVGYELGWDVINASRLAAKLRASEAQFRQVVEAVPNAIVVVDAGGAIVLANAQAETVFGCPRTDLVGKSVETLVPGRLRARHEAHRGGYMVDAQPRAMGAGRELHALRRDGSEIPVEVALNPMGTPDGRFVLVSIVDISERRRAERAAARQRDELAHLSRVAMLGELSGSLAHELNQPLAAILSNAQAAQRFLARDPPAVAQIGEILADIVTSDRRAAMVIQRLRSLLRKEESERHALDVNDLVHESLGLIRSDLLNRQVSVRADLEAAIPAIDGDRVQIQQVLLNFVVNGCDAMEGRDAGRHLVVRTRSNGSGVEVAVTDCETGIPPEDIERIFEPFMTTKSHGMGLGLAICKSIVEAHGGRTWASNNPGGGATLHFELPRRQA